jgi:hypothetical protein
VITPVAYAPGSPFWLAILARRTAIFDDFLEMRH